MHKLPTTGRLHDSGITKIKTCNLRMFDTSTIYTIITDNVRLLMFITQPCSSS